MSVDEGEVNRFCFERLREVVSLKGFLCCIPRGLGLAAELELSALPLLTDLIVVQCRERMSGTLLAWINCGGTRFKRSKGSVSISKYLSVGCVSRRKIWVIGRADTGVVPDGNPWFSSRREPGSSTGSSEETEKGGLGRGFCTNVDLEQAAALGTGERSMPLNAVCKLLAALTRAALY